ncbi:hypothetical protein [Pelagicoccus sp. SDUM812003]|uniref:hypothetical protein n=1 Tax=Pelagicoccus sp. SDUM812003 TaxID=3041267 RepID=UPI00280E587E|nr:hypothetical protein [Pelagicoccus sp. SDUM812003]MDQ8205538.1 hypothetical protein [Pelagicoccus sp. SDUM812003]
MKYFLDQAFIVEGKENGKCSDFYFDDNQWRLRYLVVKQGIFLNASKSLLSPSSLLRSEIEARAEGIPLNISSEKLDTAPTLDERLPVSRQKEMEIASHYSWSTYWEAPSAIQPAASMDVPPLLEPQDERDQDPNLRSFQEVLGYRAQNANSTLGELNDFILDLSDFSIPFMAIDAKPGESGGTRLISTRLPENRIRFNYAQKEVLTDCSSFHLKESPSADLSDGRLSLGDQQKVTLASHL